MKKKKRKRKTANQTSKVSSETKALSDSNEIKPSVKGMIIALIACVPLLILGIVLIYIGLDLDKKPCTATTQGVVTEINKTHGSHGISYYSVTYTFEVNGKEFTSKFTQSDTTRIVSIEGKGVTVCYDPDAPDNSYVKEDDEAEETGDRLLVGVGIMWIIFYLLLTWFIFSFHKELKDSQNKKSHPRRNR